MKILITTLLLTFTLSNVSFGQNEIAKQYVRDKLMDKFLASNEKSLVQSSKVENKAIFIRTKHCGNNDCPILFTNHQGKVEFVTSDKLLQLGIPRNKYAEIISLDYDKETMSVGVQSGEDYQVLNYSLN